MCAEAGSRVRQLLVFLLILSLLAVPVRASEDVTHRIHLRSNMGGTVTVSADAAPAGSLVTVEAVPEEGWIVWGINIYYDSEECHDLQITYLSENARSFRMPPCEIRVEVEFMCLGAPFDDVAPERYCYDSVLWAVQSGITKGTGPRSFSPDKPCTRAQVVTFLWRAAGCPEPTVREHPFTDVKEGAFYYDAMLWAVENGITNGTSKNAFGPDKTCNRGQVVTFLHRSCGDQDPVTMEHSFTDLDENRYYYRSVLWAIQQGITNGVTDNSFAPEAACTRGQAVTFLFRYFMNMH